MIELNVYKNNDSTSDQYGLAYARVDYKEMYTLEKLNKDTVLGWTKKAQELIDADKAAMNTPSQP